MNIDYCRFLLVATLLLGGCEQKTPLAIAELPPTRVVATVYEVQTDTGEVPCYQAPDAHATRVTQLRDKQVVDLVSPPVGMVKQGEEYWLHVYPRLNRHSACYINIRYLMPIS